MKPQFEIKDNQLNLARKFPKMTSKKALEVAIQKWQLIVNYYELGTQEVLRAGGHATCALCHLYFKYDSDSDDWSCAGCPVFEKTKRFGCDGTPHPSYESAVIDRAFKRVLNAAKKELAFLESLRTKEK